MNLLLSGKRLFCPTDFKNAGYEACPNLLTMKKIKKTPKDELCAEYKRADFTGKMVRGTHAKRLREASNIVLLKPEVAAAFPNEKAVNKALQFLIEVAQATTGVTRRSSKPGKKRCAA